MKGKRPLLPIAASVFLLGTLSCYWIPRLRSALQFTPDRLPDARIGIPYEVEITVTQNVTPVIDFGLSTGVLPAGLTLEKIQGADVARIRGTPQESGSFPFTLSAWCYGTNVSGQTGEQHYTLTVGK